MSDVIDAAREVREGEELDGPKLLAYLKGAIPGLSGDLTIQQFPSGHSNLTYLLRIGGRELVLRRPPFGSRVKTAHDMGREYRVLSHLTGIYPPAPKPLAHCEDPGVIGAPFYVMERIRGIIPRRKMPRGLDVTPELARRISESFIDNLAALHRVDYRAAGLGDLGRPEGYVERQVTGWAKRYKESQTDEVESVDIITNWLSERIPVESGAALIHNDYKYDNCVLDPADPTRIIGVLDWEMATVGDPLMDVGTALGYWIEENDNEMMRALPFGPTDLPGTLTRRELVERYAEQMKRPVPDMLFYYAFALFKTAVVAQQIYYRYKQGLTKDERFAAMIFGVQLLTQRAVEATQTGRI